MKRGFPFFMLAFIMCLEGLLATCEESQIDINTASAEELDTLYGIGPAKAQAIIDARPFASVDSLIDANGIGEKTLEGIKSQNLACVDKETEINTEEDKPQEKTINKEKSQTIEKPLPEKNLIPAKEEIIEEKPILETIKLTPQTIKTEQNNNSNKTKYAMYGFVGFCVLIAVLFLLRRNSFKNEFR
jgi:competence ComEA-like helix-hairpin-helix protein